MVSISGDFVLASSVLIMMLRSHRVLIFCSDEEMELGITVMQTLESISIAHYIPIGLITAFTEYRSLAALHSETQKFSSSSQKTGKM